MVDENKYDTIEAEIRFGEESSEYIQNCNCIELDQDNRILTLTLQSTYNDPND